MVTLIPETLATVRTLPSTQTRDVVAASTDYHYRILRPCCCICRLVPETRSQAIAGKAKLAQLLREIVHGPSQRPDETPCPRRCGGEGGFWGSASFSCTDGGWAAAERQSAPQQTSRERDDALCASGDARSSIVGDRIHDGFGTQYRKSIGNPCAQTASSVQSLSPLHECMMHCSSHGPSAYMLPPITQTCAGGHTTSASHFFGRMGVSAAVLMRPMRHWPSHGAETTLTSNRHSASQTAWSPGRSVAGHTSGSALLQIFEQVPCKHRRSPPQS